MRLNSKQRKRLCKVRENEYIRTPDGIRKIVKINTGNDITIFGTYILDKKYKGSFSIAEKNILKHSFNIAYLIEVGDIVEISDVLHNDIFYVWSEEMVKALIEDVENGMQIKSIVTKEQFESIKYEVIK